METSRPLSAHGTRAAALTLCLALLALASCDEKNPTDAAEPVSPSLQETALASQEGVGALVIPLPVDQNVATTAPDPAFRVNQTGTGPNGVFQISNSTNAQTALQGLTNGRGRAGLFQNTNGGNTQATLQAQTNGLGAAIQAGASGSGSAIQAVANGSGAAGFFRLTNAASTTTALAVVANNATFGGAFVAQQIGRGYSGIFSITNGSNSANALTASTSGTGLALRVVGPSRFEGNVTVNGTLTKRAGSFRIDHPLDPEHKYLSHSFVESPDMMNVYNGNVTLDASGRATVELPDYFEALNRDFRYQLTAIGAPGPNLYIAEGVTQNRFQIAGGRAYAHVSWQVTGVRQDAYAEEHRIRVEEDKPPAERDLVARR